MVKTKIEERLQREVKRGDRSRIHVQGLGLKTEVEKEEHI